MLTILLKYLDRDIVTIRYNVLNLPDIIQFKNGNQIKNLYDAGGHKLQAKYYTRINTIPVPIAENQIATDVTSTYDYQLTGTDYVSNYEYAFSNDQGDYQHDLDKIYNDEGYVQGLTSPQYYYFRHDHLGDNREVWCANSGQTVQRTQYYPSGLPWTYQSGDNPDLQHRKYNGKEFIEMHGFDETELGWRGLYHALCRFTRIDRFAEKYYSLSPYSFAAGNPVNNIDINGDSLMLFKNGTYVSTVDNGKSEMTGYNQESSVDKDGNETFNGGQSFSFNDQEVDPQAVRSGGINKVEFVSDATVNNQIGRSGVNEHKGIGYAYSESHASGKMDYGYQGIEKYKDLNEHSFYVRNGIAYNVADYGNYLWGRGMALLGIDVGVASFGAHWNNFWNGRRGRDDYKPYNLGLPPSNSHDFFDSPADQRSIIRGSESVNGAYKPKPFTWPTNSFILK